MDASLFTDRKTGELTRVTHRLENRADWAFIPNPMPPSWQPSRKLFGLAGDAMASIAELNGICSTLLPNPELLLHPLQTREALTSSKIEGTFISAEQYLLFGGGHDEETDKRGSLDADWVEVQNYGRALRWGLAELKNLPVSGRLMKGMHQRLMSGVRGEGKTPGEYRRNQVQVGSTARYVPPPADRVGDLMANLEHYANAELEDRLEGLIRCFVVHYQFEAIHPFNDGNGRVGRALLAPMVCGSMTLSMPWLYMSAYFERFKDEYIDKLFAVSSKGAWDEWIGFCLRGAVWQANDAKQRCRRFKRIMDSYHVRAEVLPPRVSRLIRRLLEYPFITIRDIRRECAVTDPTARRYAELLEGSGILVKLEGSKNPQVFVAWELFRAAYLDEAEAAPSTDAGSPLPSPDGAP